KVICSTALVAVNPDNRTTSDIDIFPTGCNRFRLSRGSILTYNDRPFVYDTPNGSVQVGERSAVLISVEPKLTRVLDLSDAGRRSVVVIAGKRIMPLVPGNEVSIASASRYE